MLLCCLVFHLPCFSFFYLLGDSKPFKHSSFRKTLNDTDNFRYLTLNIFFDKEREKIKLKEGKRSLTWIDDKKIFDANYRIIMEIILAICFIFVKYLFNIKIDFFNQRIFFTHSF